MRFLRGRAGGRRTDAAFRVDRDGGVLPGCARTGAGETPALPGGVLPSLLLLKRACRVARPQPHRCARAVPLGGPSCVLRGFLFFRLFKASEAPALPCRSSESETIRNRPIPSRPWYPVTVHLNALVSLRRSSWPFVDSSFSFVFFRLFQTSVAPALPCRSSESKTIRNRPIPSRPWYPVTVHLNALVSLRRPSCVFVDHSFSFVFFRLFQASPAESAPLFQPAVEADGFDVG